MTLTLDERVEVLEDKVENLETNAGPGRVDAHSGNVADLRSQLSRFGEVQAKQSQTLDIHTGQLAALDRSMISVRFDVGTTQTSLKRMADEVTGKLERLDRDVSWLKGTAEKHDGLIIALSIDVAGLKDEIAGLRTDVNGRLDGLGGEVAELRTELGEFKVEVRGTLKEILDRLPAKAA